MISRWKVVYLLLLLTAVLAEESPPGLVSKDSEQDLVAEATHSGSTAQKREAGLSNSYGEPLPADAYGPPKDLPNINFPHPVPAPVYGVPDHQVFQNTPPGAYGPPAPINIPSQTYHGPPPPLQGRPKPIYGPPKPIYGPPKPVYGPPKFSPPKQSYGPPKKTYGPPKQSLPKPTYGVPFKPPKITLNKPLFSNPKPVYGPPKPVYGPPPKITYGVPLANGPPALPLPELPQISLPPLDNNIDFGVNLPAPIYGTPLVSLPVDLKPNFPLPTDTYGPPGHVLGPVGPNDQLVVQNIGSIGHYGPPQPDPNPQPPHPGIPAPPTPPHVLYDGWKPIPGVSKPIGQISDQYGPPAQEIHINLDQSLPNVEQHHQFTSGSNQFLGDGNQFTSGSHEFGGGNNQFSSAQISSGYANVHHDALSNIDLNAIVGGDSNNIDQSKTVFEAHYTENHGPQAEISSVQVLPEKPIDSYGAPPLETLSNGPYPASLRQQGAKGLVAPSGLYGVPPGSQYGAPPRHGPGLPLPYGYHSGGGHSGGSIPRQPIKFRESVPEGLFENIAHTTHHKDSHGIDHAHHGPSYLPPPIRDIKDVNIQTNSGGFHSGNSVSLSIEPTNLYSLPHAGSPISFQQAQQPSNLYGSPIDSYSVPLLTVGIGDHVTSGSNTNTVTSTIDGTLLANLSNLDAAAILKHCPYHEAILRAAKAGEKIPADLATSYINSLSSLGTTLNKSSNTITIPDSFTKDLLTSHSVIRSVSNDIKNKENYNLQKSKSLKEKHSIKDERLQYVSDQIQKTSDRIRDLNEEAKLLQQKIVSSSQNINTASPIPSKIGSYDVQIQASNGGKSSIPHDQLLSEGLLQSILQAIEEPGKQGQKQQAQYQQQNQNQQQNQHQQQNQYQQQNQNQQQSQHQQHNQNQQSQYQQQTQQQQQYLQQQSQQQQHSSQQSIQQSLSQQQNQQSQLLQQNLPNINYQNFNPNVRLESFSDGLILPAGYEPVDHTKNDQDTQSSKNIQHIIHSERVHHSCDLKTEGSAKNEVVVPPPTDNSIEKDENEVAVYFDEKDPVTEISVATSISEEDDYSKAKA